MRKGFSESCVLCSAEGSGSRAAAAQPPRPATMETGGEAREADSGSRPRLPIIPGSMREGKAVRCVRVVLSRAAPSSPLSPRGRTEACIRADNALRTLSGSDISEVRAYKQPPPQVCSTRMRVSRVPLSYASHCQVQLVVSGLTILLTGEALNWQNARRFLASADKLMAAINAIDRDAIPTARLRAIWPIINNPAFHPDAVVPVCRAAAGLAAWVRTRRYTDVLSVTIAFAGSCHRPVRCGHRSRPSHTRPASGVAA